ncbi:TonB-dependent receptor [Bacteroides caecigallinarum]|uniref:TonB-dependent receptor n=1 Tax=Candidatus Phocaeicola faecigallinarum TaxID=2838732 RepID=A0A948TBX3_9BACT|nr:TonB-dependent receptor [Bacteroides caecigallinarum]MBM6883733.1 TonB-dependent receptor [Bacteroides caecigallinarum]MBM6890386.1 TonB-dependent receptor [Bacteroides caecigallinarum]MBU3837890.1 TonB-dependent receptor [Candidatus Phocaeicola faecigallinarum]
MKVFKAYFLLMFVLLMSNITVALGQNRVLSGKVMDNLKEPLIGVSIQVAGTTMGTITSDDGTFQVNVPVEKVTTLHMSYVGYLTQKIEVKPGENNIVVYMQEDAIMLEEAVVVGYGTQKKVNLTGAITTVGSEKLENRVSHSLTNMLQGSVPGLNVTTSSGVPGSSAAINVRGVTSINSSDPLVLIDGAVGDMSRVNPNDVESISVIKDASAAAVYGARAAFGVILITTKSGAEQDGKATVRYSGRLGWEAPTTSTDYEDTGYWSVYTINKFWKAENGGLYVDYTDYDMQQLLARVNDKTENPDRPWTVIDERNGRKQWVYYGNYDWWHMLYNDNRPVQQHNVSISGGNKDVKYMVSGAYNYQKGMLKENPDIYNKYNLRSKIDMRINKWANFTNNTSFYGSQYSFQGDGSVENTIAYGARHALACFPMKNPDGSWLYSTPYLNYKVGNGRHIMLGEGSHRNVDRTNDFSNTSRLVITPIKPLSFTADFTYRLYQTRNTSRSNVLYYREYPDAELGSYATGAGANRLDESVNTRNYYSANVFANYDDTFNEVHHLSGVIGFNYETMRLKNISAYGENLSSTSLDDFNLVGQNSEGQVITGVDGSQNAYALAGFFGRINYDYAGRYLFEVSGRYDGTSRFAQGSRWGFFPSGSLGWRISEEPFFKPLSESVDNLKLRASFGSLGNQNVSSYYTYMRLVSISDFAAYSFGEGSSMAKYSTLSAPVSSDLTWETSQQWDLGLDLSMFGNRLNVTFDGYVRNTLNMLTDGIELPAVYGASVPDMNTADLQTRGYELAVNWRDQFSIIDSPFEYSVGFNISNYKSYITKYDNKDKTFAKTYYEGMRLGEIWGFVTDGLFATTEEAQAYAQEVDLSYINNRVTGGWQAGDLKFLDLDGDNVLGIGANSVDDPGDRKILGNSLPSLSYGFNASVSWYGFDASVFFQGTGNHYWYPTGQAMQFWGPYSYPYLTFLQEDFLDEVWAEDNPDAYFTRPMAYSATSGPLSKVNDRYLQNIRYMRLKNLTVGYTVPVRLSKKIGIEQARIYFSGENLCYWSPLKKHTKYIDPEAALDRSDAYNNAYYPWSKTFMFGLDITF